MGCTGSKQGYVPPATGFKHIPGEFAEYPAGEQQYFVCTPQERRAIAYTRKGDFSLETTPAKTLLELFLQAKTTNPNSPALRQEWPVPELGTPSVPREEWKTWTYEEYWNESRQVAKSLKHLGVSRYEGVCVFGSNTPQWFLAAMGSVMAGALIVGIYPTDSQDQVDFKVKHCRAQVAIVEDWSKVERLQTSTTLKHIVGFSPVFEVKQRMLGDIQIHTWTEFLALGADAYSDQDLDAIQAEIVPEDCISLIYTSGTTGNAKGVMISHDNAYCQCISVIRSMPEYGMVEERMLSFLPLSHIAGFVLDSLLPIVTTAERAGFSTTYFTRAYDLRSGTIGDRIKAVRPTMFFAVPRVWEKFADKLRSIEPESGLKQKIFQWAKRTGEEYYTNKQVGGSGMEPRSYPRAKKMVHDKIRAAIGLDQCKLLVSGAAPLPIAVQTYLTSLGLNVMEVYGMSESCGSATANGLECYSFGSCGGMAPICEVKVLRKDDEKGEQVECPTSKNWRNPTEEEQGELCYRGRTIMLGYMCGEGDNIEEILKKNQEAIDANGWLHSGDKGCKDEFGMFHVTGRYKELIITAGGENIAPVPIEDAIKALGKGVVNNVHMVGDKQKYNVALITLLTKGATGEKPGEGVLEDSAAKLVPGVTTVKEACASKEFVQQVEQWISQVNANGKVVVSNAAKVQKFTILPVDYSIETGELTATLKLKRNVAEKLHGDALQAMYSDESNRMFVPAT